MENKMLISKEEYEALVRQSERLATLERVIDKERYVSTDEIRKIIGWRENKEPNIGVKFVQVFPETESK